MSLFVGYFSGLVIGGQAGEVLRYQKSLWTARKSVKNQDEEENGNRKDRDYGIRNAYAKFWGQSRKNRVRMWWKLFSAFVTSYLCCTSFCQQLVCYIRWYDSSVVPISAWCHLNSVWVLGTHESSLVPKFCWFQDLCHEYHLIKKTVPKNDMVSACLQQ